MMLQSTDSLRIIPSNWMGPLDLDSVFGHQPGTLEVDLGCGKGRFLLARAERHPDISFLGMDRLLLRLLRVERKAQRQRGFNIRLLYVDAYYAVSYLLPVRSVATYYIFFPDPWPKRRHQRHRLFNADFLNALDRTLIPAGCIHVATDYTDYFEHIRRIFSHDTRFQPIAPLELSAEERTDFELLFLNEHRLIGRCSFRKTS